MWTEDRINNLAITIAKRYWEKEWNHLVKIEEMDWTDSPMALTMENTTESVQYKISVHKDVIDFIEEKEELVPRFNADRLIENLLKYSLCQWIHCEKGLPHEEPSDMSFELKRIGCEFDLKKVM